MKFEDLDLSEMPTNFEFAKLVDKQFYLWERYTPTTVEADIPFEQDWWKYVHWMPKIKKEFYLHAIKALDFEKDLQDLVTIKYGMDYWFFTNHYDFLIARMKWMRKQSVTHIGECK